MKILAISHKYPPSVGGMQYHCYKLLQALEVDHQVIPLIFKSNYPKILFFLAAVIRARVVLWKHRDIDVIYVNDGLMALIVTPLVFLTKTPIIVTIHGLDVSFPLGIYGYWIRTFLNKFNAIIAVSQSTYDLCIRKGIDASRLHLVMNAVDLNIQNTQVGSNLYQEIFKQTGQKIGDKFKLISLGRGVPRKGLLWFTKNVLPMLPNDVVYVVICPEFKSARLFKWLKRLLPTELYRKICLLIGAEIDAGEIEEMRRNGKLSDQVVFLPQYARDREMIMQLLTSSDLFIMANLKVKDDFEGFGLVALEASGSGLLTLASNVDGIPSAVQHRKNGILIDPGDAEAWSRKILELKKSDSKRHELAAKYQKYTLSKLLSWTKMAKEYIGVFQTVQSK